MRRRLWLSFALFSSWLRMACTLHARPASNALSMTECMRRSGYDIDEQWRPNTNLTWKMMSTVEPRRYMKPSGFASRCDWVIGSRAFSREMRRQIWGDISVAPRTIFVNVREAQSFNDLMLPCFDASARFIVITGDADLTMPQQLDERFPSPSLKSSDWDKWLDDDRIVHLFIEHLDVKASEKVTPLPLGLDPDNLDGCSADAEMEKMLREPAVEITERQFLALQADRQRPGEPQFEDRVLVRKLCEAHWKGVCEPALGEIDRTKFFSTVQQYSFLICVHGGGIDPNPKAWTALMAGAIPIIRRFPGDDLYACLPVVRISTWDERTLSKARMKEWLQQLAPHFTDKALRAAVVKQLMAGYWWSKIEWSFDHPGQAVSISPCDSQVAIDA